MQSIERPPEEPPRHRLPLEREGVNHHVQITSTKEVEPGRNELVRTDLYIVANRYPDGSPAEVFARIDQAGSRVSCLVDAWCTAVSVALQHGLPLESFTSKVIGSSYEPSGPTTNPTIPYAKSPLDYIGRWLEEHFGIEREPVV
jgi:ribonucleoside-diphosphate reductase alpha chain